MFFQAFLCVLVAALISLCSSALNQETRYECGAHGKFEYCIDGIPGCVIGCHCHPGYYFDTDTKICEPNFKLTQDFRRRYMAEPTRVYAPEPPEYIPPVTKPAPTPTTTDNIDEKVDEIAKADDLGDWLYNQFFKTIENQVINNTETKPKEKEMDKPPTRRSGGDSGPVINKSKRKARKSMKSGKKKKRTKVHGLRRKLLRITEDDSLFDSESDSGSSDSDSDSNSDSDSGSSDDSSSKGSDSSSGDGKKSKSSPNDDKDHGHKKVIIFNKRPKPPLPSFIFLPSMDTPFYPPIGLPPPPAYPMYPMVPVPPMAPMFPPFPGTPGCDEGESNSTTGSSDTTTTPQTDTTTTTTTTEANADEPAPVVPPPPDDKQNSDTPTLLKRRSRLEKQLGRKLRVEEFARTKDSGKPLKMHSKANQRSKLMQKLRDKMIAKRLNSAPASTAPEHMEADIPLADQVPISQEAFIPPNAMPAPIVADNNPMIPKLEDVDFKYLSELIHRVNQSDARTKLAALPFDLNDDLKELQKIKSQQSRRNLNPYNVEPAYTEANTGYNQHRHLHKQGSPDDAYYTNLGRQIASMIRSADSRIDQQLNAEIDQTVRPLPFHPVINENNFAPRSYWERSVRSPLTGMENYNNYLDKSRTLRQSNENSLFNLENEVESFASTTNPLSLQDLENILNTMEKAHAHIKYTNPLKFTKHSNYSLNVSLLPKLVRPENKYRRVFQTPDHDEYVQPSNAPLSHAPAPRMPQPRAIQPEVIPQKKSMERNASNVTVFLPQRTNIVVPLNDFWMYNSHNHNLRPMPLNQQSKPVLQENTLYNSNPTRNPGTAEAASSDNMARKPHVEYLQFLRSMPVVKNTTPKRPHPKLLSSPPVVNYKNLNYFSGNKHHYMFESASYPLQVPLKRQINKQFAKRNPSYFHHELHHFDYFD